MAYSPVYFQVIDLLVFKRLLVSLGWFNFSALGGSLRGKRLKLCSSNVSSILKIKEFSSTINFSEK
jgi:hypothetical protein